MRSDIAWSTLSILGGAAAGAITMFLMDPERGDARRKEISSSAWQAADTARDSARKWAGKASDYAKDLSDQVASQAADSATSVARQAQTAVDRAKAQLAESAKALADRAKAYADQAHRSASDVHDDLHDRASSIYSRAKTSAYRRAGVQESHPYRVATEITAGTVGMLALGAGLMFFFDPAKGRARRAWTQQKVTKWANKVNKSANGYSRHVANKVQGAVAEVKGAVPQEWSQAVNRVSNAAITPITHQAEDQSPSTP